MNKKIILILMLVLSAGYIYAQEKIDFSRKPEALPAESFKFPDYIETKLENGTKVFIVQDREQPTISIRLLIPGGSVLDGNKPGIADLMTDMVTKGAGEMTALQIAETLDGIGADVSASANKDYIAYSASGLKKHMDKILKVFANVLIHPTFPQNEFDKLIPQKLAGLKNEKTDPAKIASDLSDMVVYGKLHPYGLFETEKSIKSITINDLKSYYNAVIKPNNASIVVVGDVNEKEIVNALNNALKDWQPGKTAFIQIPPAQSMPLGVYFIERPGSVQSYVSLVSVAPARKDPDWEIESLASSIMGGGFGSRLFRILREEHSYTYSPRASLSSNKFVNKFVAYANVRNSVTDSSLTIMIDLLRKLANEPSPNEEIGRVKQHSVGQYMMAFEEPGFLARIIQNADFNGIPIQRVKSWHTRYLNISPYEVMEVAKTYMEPEKSFIVVVGAPEMRTKLEKFGPVFDYNLDLDPISGKDAKMENVSIDAEELIEKYTDAIGGNDILDKINTMTIDSKVVLNAGGQEMHGTMKQIFKAPNKLFRNLDLSVVKQEFWCDGTQVWSKSQQGLQEIKDKELEKSKLNSVIFKDAKLLTLGFKCKVLGKQNGMLVMEAANPELNESKKYYYDEKTFLISKIEEMTEGPRGEMFVTTEYNDYKTINGITVPMKILSTNPMYSITSENTYKFNEEVDDSTFQPAEK